MNKVKKTVTIAVDFDGTCVRHEYPEIGEDIGAQYWLKRFQEIYDLRYILLTMRSGETLKEAQDWFTKNEIDLWATNSNPSQLAWTKSRKVYANLYIDDAGLGIPLEYYHPRYHVEWGLAGPMVEDWLIHNARTRNDLQQSICSTKSRTV